MRLLKAVQTYWVLLKKINSIFILIQFDHRSVCVLPETHETLKIIAGAVGGVVVGLEYKQNMISLRSDWMN